MIIFNKKRLDILILRRNNCLKIDRNCVLKRFKSWTHIKKRKKKRTFINSNRLLLLIKHLKPTGRNENINS